MLQLQRKRIETFSCFVIWGAVLCPVLFMIWYDPSRAGVGPSVTAEVLGVIARLLIVTGSIGGLAAVLLGIGARSYLAVARGAWAFFIALGVACLYYAILTF